MGTKLRTFGWIIGIILFILLAGFIYSTFFKPTYGQSNTLILLIAGLLLGGLIAFLLTRLTTCPKSATPAEIRESSHTVVESMRKVFKIVSAEGQFNELYNYEETKKIFNFIPNTKKALVIVKAKVMIGYDFEKCVWKANEADQTIRLISFPEPEILSVEPEYKYYNLEENIFNLFSREDLEKIQSNGKKQVELAAMSSDLKQMAADQMKTLLTEMIGSKKWLLENPQVITNQLPKNAG